MPLTYTLIHNNTKGGQLPVKTLKHLLNASYDPLETVEGYNLDKHLSSKTSKVYFNPKTSKAVVAHQGTSGLSDWFNNFIYALGGKKLYKLTSRYKQAKKVQEASAEKYGNDNITTIGHSQGGLQAELLGKPTHEIITLNKATRPFSNTKHLNQYDIKTQNDIVSSLNPIQGYSSNDLVIPSQSRNPLTEHSIETLDRIDPDQVIGRGAAMSSVIKEEVAKKFPRFGTEIEIDHIAEGRLNAAIDAFHVHTRTSPPRRIILVNYTHLFPMTEEAKQLPFRIILNIIGGQYNAMIYCIEDVRDFNRLKAIFLNHARQVGITHLPAETTFIIRGEWY